MGDHAGRPGAALFYRFAAGFLSFEEDRFILHFPWPFLSFLVMQPCRLARQDNESYPYGPQRKQQARRRGKTSVRLSRTAVIVHHLRI